MNLGFKAKVKSTSYSTYIATWLIVAVEFKRISCLLIAKCGPKSHYQRLFLQLSAEVKVLFLAPNLHVVEETER